MTPEPFHPDKTDNVVISTDMDRNRSLTHFMQKSGIGSSFVEWWYWTNSTNMSPCCTPLVKIQYYLLWSQLAANKTRIFLPYRSKLESTPGNPSLRACLIPGSVAFKFLNISRFCWRYSKYWARRRNASKWLNFRARRNLRMKASSVLRKPMSGRVMIMSLTSCMSWCKVSGFSFNSTLAFSSVSGERPACKWVIVLVQTRTRRTKQ